MHFFKKAGYLHLTPLQRFCIPLILKGKSLAIEAGEHTGKTAALILPMITRFFKGKGGIKAVVLVPDLEIAKKVSREIKKFIPDSPKNNPYLILGLQDGGRNDYRQLQRKPRVLIGTTEKIIDHIRRGNLDFSNMKFLAADMPTVKNVPGFIQDVFFIQSKIPRKTQHVFMYPNDLSEIDELLSSSTYFQCISKTDWGKTSNNLNLKIIEVPRNQDKEQAIYDLFYGKKMNNLIILNNDSDTNNRLVRNLRKAKVNIQLLKKEAITKEKTNLIGKFNNQLSRILIIPESQLNPDKFLDASHLIFFTPQSVDPKSIQKTLRSIADITEAIFLTTPSETKKIESLKETIQMNIKQDNYPQKEEIFKGYIETILDKIKNTESIEELEKFKKMFKQNVPFFMRSYFSAYLLKETLSNQKSHKPRSKSSTNSRSSSSFSSSSNSSNVTMFVSIGKNRRVFPKDLTTLFMTTLNIKKSDIKEVKVLDSYSFVDIPSQYGKDAISKLSGIDYKGRKITVNFARKRERPSNKN